ncbi:MAG: hypothetical protein JW822_10090 [Spirochaetales bacterium]|nr:hypothetical protein [Spirochaetales bacterium]
MAVFVFLIMPASGHVNPTLPIVKELLKKGHRVVYYGTDEFKSKIAKTGAEYKKYNLTGFVFDRYGILQNLFEFSVFLCKTAFRISSMHLAEIAGQNPDCVVYDSLWAAGKIIARKLGVSYICSVPILVCDDKAVKSNFTPSFIIRQFTKNIHHISRMLLYMILSFIRTRILLNPFDVFLNKAPLNIVYTSRFFQPAAEALGTSFHFVGPSITERSEDDDFPLERLEGNKVVYISFGTIINDRPEFYRHCMNLFKQSSLTVVISIGNRIKAEDLCPVPSNVIIKSHVPQLKVLKKTAVFITHAGMNSIQEALFFGVPMVMLPQTPEQTATARRVAELGAGIILRRGTHPAEIRRAVEIIMQDKSYKEHTHAISKTLRNAGGYKRAVNEMLKLIESKGLRRE